jgi:hypothetical protein
VLFELGTLRMYVCVSKLTVRRNDTSSCSELPSLSAIAMCEYVYRLMFIRSLFLICFFFSTTMFQTNTAALDFTKVHFEAFLFHPFDFFFSLLFKRRRSNPIGPTRTETQDQQHWTTCRVLKWISIIIQSTAVAFCCIFDRRRPAARNTSYAELRYMVIIIFKIHHIRRPQTVYFFIFLLLLYMYMCARARCSACACACTFEYVCVFVFLRRRVRVYTVCLKCFEFIKTRRCWRCGDKDRNVEHFLHLLRLPYDSYIIILCLIHLK